MESGRSPLKVLQEAPRESLTLLIGPPGSGKSTFCHQIVLNSLAAEKPIIFITTEQHPSKIDVLLQDSGIGEAIIIRFIDAFANTVGINVTERSDTVCANCADLNSINMAVAKLQNEIGRPDILLAFDSLTSPYLFNRNEIFRFIKLCLAKFAAEGNSVVALVDEGCGNEEDLVAMMSMADNIIKMEIKDNVRIINVVKHPQIAPARIEVPARHGKALIYELDHELMKTIWGATYRAAPGKALRTEVGDYVHMIWKDLALWSGMLWDPKRFPEMVYGFDRESHARTREWLQFAPWRMRMLFKYFMPESFSTVKDMKKFFTYFKKSVEKMGLGIWEYRDTESKEYEHIIRIYENSTCWAFDGIGVRLGFPGLGSLAGFMRAFDVNGLNWDAIETRCVATGDGYCEIKIVPDAADELNGFLGAIDSSITDMVRDRLMSQITDLLVHEKPLPERPRLKGGISFNRFGAVTSMPALFSERYRMALRMGGARTGNELSKSLMDSGVKNDDVIKRVIEFMNYCKVGKVTLDNTITIKQNCESFGLEIGEPSCYFTTGFLNGIFSSLRNKHVREIKCIAAGDPFCEWDII